MIRVESITITEFRGIRDLTLNFKQKNFAVCGPNGTGKSGVVDALEFVLTGNVSRLSGEGCGDISLKEHGPHVDMRQSPEKAHVKATITIPNLGKTVIIKRNLQTPTKVQVTPSDPKVAEVLLQVQGHPEIVLSRREIIRYVLATPGNRAKEVQALLHLDQVEDVRTNLQKIANSCERQMPSIIAAVSQAHEKLLQVLEISQLTKEHLLAAVNARRAILGLKALEDLTESTSFRDGMAAVGPAVLQRIPKTSAVASIRTARESLATLNSSAVTAVVASVADDLRILASNPGLAAAAKREAFYTVGMELIETEACPLCDIRWDIAEIKRHIQTKIRDLEELSRKREAVEGKIAPLIEILSNVRAMITALVDYAVLATPPQPIEAARDYAQNCEKSIERLTAR